MSNNTAAQSDVGVVVSIKGEAFASSDAGTRQLEEGDSIFLGETISTRQESQIEIQFLDDTALSQGENSETRIDEYVYDPDNGSNSSLLLEMSKGVFRTVTGEIAKQNPDGFNLKSPMALIGIRGTTVVGSVSSDGTTEKWGVEQIGTDHVLVVQDGFGNIQFISEASLVIDFFKDNPISPARQLTPQELDFFQSMAPISVFTGEDTTADDEDQETDGDGPEGFSEEGDGASQDLSGSSGTPQDMSGQNLMGAPQPQAPVYTATGLQQATQTGQGNDTTDNGDDDTQEETDEAGSTTNLAPTANDDYLNTLEDKPLEFNINDLIGNDTDPEGDALSLESVTDPANGSITYISGGNGDFIYTPDDGFFGEDSFTYTITDDSGNTSEATVYVTVEEVNNPPEAVDDSATLRSPAPIVIDVLANDTDADADTLTVVSVQQPLYGSAVLNDDGTITYTPFEDPSAEDSFTYTIHDGNGGYSSATVYLSAGLAPYTQGGQQTDIFTITDTTPVETIDDFTATEGKGANDVLLFGESFGLGTHAQGETGEYAYSGNGTVNPTQYQVVGVDQMVSGNWSDAAEVFDNAIDAGQDRESDAGTYLVATNGEDARVYYWEGDTEVNGQVDDSELTRVADLEDFTDISALGQENFQII